MNRSMPPGTVIPVLNYPDVSDAVEWLCHAFGFREHLRVGNHRAQLTFGAGAVVVAARSLESGALDVADHSVMVVVPDVAIHHDHAKAVGARIIAPPTDYPYGERQYTADDPWGRRWTFTQTIADVDPLEWGATRAD